MLDFAILDLFKTKNELVYDYLRINILKKHFKTGDKIIIKEISKSLNVSDIQVREDIKKLETQELLHVIPHVGDAGGPHRPQGIGGDLYHTQHLGVIGHPVDVPVSKTRRFPEAGKNMDKCEEAARRGKRELLSELNKQFHLEIY